MKKIILLIMFIGLAYVGVGQTTIYSEDFTGQENKGAWGDSGVGITEDLSGVDWTIDISSAGIDGDGTTNDWRVLNNSDSLEFQGQDVGGTADWFTPSIDVSSVSGDVTISCSMKVLGSGANASSEGISFSYSLDGGIYTDIYNTGFEGDNTNGTTPLTSSFISLSGSGIDVSSADELVVRVKVNVNGADDGYIFDNISVAEDAVKEEPENHVTSFTATADGHNQIDLTWNDNDGTQAADGFLIKANTSGSLTDPSDGTDPSEDTDLSDGSALVKVSHGVQPHSFTGLSETTQYYFKIWPYTNSGSDIDFKTDGTVPTANATTGEAPSLPNAWINEIHYDNDGSDTIELVEIVIETPNNYNLSDFSLNLYNGNGGASYESETINNFTDGDAEGNFTFYIWSHSSIQNGPDGLALSYSGNLIQFLSYEGTFTATDGPANGVESTDMGVSENASAVGNSLQLSGIGTQYSDFVWQDPASATKGSLNNDQYFGINITWGGGASTTSWNDANNWSNGAVPTTSENVIIPSNGQVTIAAGRATAMCNDLTIQSDAGGTGSIIVKGSLTVNGSATVQQYIHGYNAEGSVDGWHLLSSPVGTFTIAGSDFDPGSTDDFYGWEESTNTWKNHKAGNPTDIVPGKGYLVAYENSVTKEFKGALNTGDINVNGLTYNPGEGNGWNLVGNPFSSAIQWDDGNWSLTNIQATAKIRNEAGGNYIDITSDGTKNIPVNQGLFVQATADGAGLTIPSTAQVHDGQGFYKSAKEQEGFLKLKVSASANPFYDIQTIRLHEASDESYDRYDSEKFYGNENAPQLYSIDEDLGNLSTHSVHPSSIEGTRVFPLGFEAVDGEYILSLEINTLGDEYEIAAEDLQTGDMIDFTLENTYKFVAASGDNPHRFNLHLSKLTTGIETSKVLEGVNIYSHHRTIFITTNEQLTDAKITIYNAVGQLVMQQPFVSENEIIPKSTPGAYLVKVMASEGVVTKKVIIQ